MRKDRSVNWGVKTRLPRADRRLLVHRSGGGSGVEGILRVAGNPAGPPWSLLRTGLRQLGRCSSTWLSRQHPSSETDFRIGRRRRPVYNQFVHSVARLLARSTARLRGVPSVWNEKFVVPFSPVADNLDVWESAPGDRARVFRDDDLETA
jgi:hypothetical protein